MWMPSGPGPITTGHNAPALWEECPHYLKTDTIQSEEKLPVTKNAEQEDEGQINFIVRE